MNSRRTRLRSALAVILTVLVLVPTAVLFGRVWSENSVQRDQTNLEKKGVEYLTALTPLISALAESQSSALQGVTAPPDSLTAAVARVTAVDNSLGDALKTKERWAGLQAKIAKLPKTTGGTLAVLQAHIETSDLALALYAAVRRNSELNRDPDSDISNLQQAVAIDMPTTVVLVSRMGDFANILQSTNATIRATIGVQFGQEVLAVQDSVSKLTESLQAAVDDTRSSTLSGSLVSTLDSFRRGVESMTRGANPGGPPNVATMSTAQTALQTSLNALAGVTLKEMANLLEDRSGTLDYRRGEALVMGLLAILLVLAALLWPMALRRRESAPAVAAPTGESTRDVAGARPAGGYAGGSYDLQPAYGDTDPTRRERSGALR
jgi:hypothetical protein